MKIDKTETERLFRSHYAAMYRLARGILRDDEEARDAVSDVFAGLLDRERPAEVADGGTPDSRVERAYLLMAVRNRCLNAVEKKKTADRLEKALPLNVDTGRTPEEMEQEERRLDDIRRFIGSGLTPRTRDIIRMRYDEQLNCRDIAESCGISLAAVYKHIAQGIEKLKEKFNR